MPRAGGSRSNAPNRIFSGVGIVGLDDFRRDLRRYGQSVPRLLGQANHDVAEIGAARARARAQSLGSTAAHVAPSIRSGYAARYAYVAIGSNAYPMALGAEFGSKHDIPRPVTNAAGTHFTRKGFNQFREWVGNQYESGASDQGGYFLGPAMRAAEAEMLAKYMSLLDQLEKTVFYEGAA